MTIGRRFRRVKLEQRQQSYSYALLRCSAENSFGVRDSVDPNRAKSKGFRTRYYPVFQKN
jgi:hypothetical protein